jgi:nucleoside-diphosphate-sugar epimerase
VDLKNKKVFVTDSDGFIGSHLVGRLLKENCQVKAFVYYNSFSSWGWFDIGNHEDYVKAQEEFESGKDKFLPGDRGSY